MSSDITPKLSETPQAGLSLTVAEDPAVRLGFSDRHEVGNVSWRADGGAVARARGALADLVGLAPDDLVFMRQVHGAAVATVGPADRGRGVQPGFPPVDGADALVTTATDVALVVLVADCVPVLLVDPGRAVGAVHAGRRGIAAGVVEAAVAALTDTPEQCLAVVGPAIGGCCYEVPDALADDVAARVPGARTTTRWGTTSLDLPAAVIALLDAGGVGRVERAGACTRCHVDRWFSHRGDSVPGGRQAGIVTRRADSSAGALSRGADTAGTSGVRPQPL